MSRPISVEIVPSHVHLSEADQVTLFGAEHAATIRDNLSQTGQFAYAESVEIFGRLKRSLTLRVLGPCRRQTQVEITPTEAHMLGIPAAVAKSGDLSQAAACRIVGPAGEVRVSAAVIVPQAHLHCSDIEAASLHVTNGKIVSMEVLGDNPYSIENVVVRVHPSYRVRLHVHADIARAHWMTAVVHARIRDSV